jgi:death on curing protein
MPFLFPTVAEAKEYHKQLIGEFGGTHGVRDEGRLEAAILRPQIGYYETLAENAAFHDGNKRIGFAVTDAFLRLNGFCLEVSSQEAYNFITETMSRGEFRFNGIRGWISSHLVSL